MAKLGAKRPPKQDTSKQPSQHLSFPLSWGIESVLRETLADNSFYH